MAFDFPNSPTNGQIVHNGDSYYQWDGSKWQGAGNPIGGPPGSPTSTTPKMDGVANVGVEVAFARGDHVHPSDTSRATVMSAHTNVGRNLLHNALFNIQQRGTGPWTTNNYTVDRWGNLLSGGGSISTTSIALTDADRAAIGDEAAISGVQIVFTGDPAAGGYTIFTQPIEKVRRLSGKTVTVSFWARCTSGTLKIACEGLQAFGSGGSPSTSVSGTGVANTVTTTWTRYTATYSFPSVAGKTLGTNGDDYSQSNLWLSSGSNFATRAGSIGVQSGTIQLWGMQLEIASQATPLEKVDPGEDLRRCQRFYQIATAYNLAYGTAGNLIGNWVGFSTTMRAAPSIAFVGPTYSNASGLTVGGPQTNGVNVYATVTASGHANYTANVTASADL